MRIAPCVLFALVACAPERVTVTGPPLEGARTVLLQILADSPETLVYLFEIEDGTATRFEPPESVGSSFDLRAALYDCPPSILGFTEGKVVLAGKPSSAEIPTPRSLFLTTVQEGSSDPWTELTETPTDFAEILAQVPVEQEADCNAHHVRFDGIPIPLPDTRTTNVSLVVPFDDRALVGTEDGKLFVVENDSAVRLSGLPDLPHGAGVMVGDTIWLFGADQSIGRGHPDRGFVVDPYPMTIGRNWRWAAALDESSVLVMSEQGTVARVTSAGWERLGSVSYGRSAVAHQGDKPWSGSIKKVGENDAILVGPSELRHNDRGEMLELYRFPEIARFTAEQYQPLQENGIVGIPMLAVGGLPSLGYIVGMASGDLFYSDGEADWQVLGESPLLFYALTFARVDDGFLFGGEFGLFVQYHPRAGFCGLDGLGHGFTTDLVPWEDGFAAIGWRATRSAAGEQLSVDDTVLIRLRRHTPRHPCL